jgi:hypothetical protein
VNVTGLTLFVFMWNMILLYLCKNFEIILKYMRFEVLTLLLLLLLLIADSRLLGYGTESLGKQSLKFQRKNCLFLQGPLGLFDPAF